MILHSTGKQVISFDSENKAHQALEKIIKEATKEGIESLNAVDSPIKGLRRINEASRFFENEILQYIDEDPNFSCEVPKNAKGKEQRSGYPDLLITHLPSDTKAFLDPKLYEDKSEKSSLYK